MSYRSQMISNKFLFNIAFSIQLPCLARLSLSKHKTILLSKLLFVVNPLVGLGTACVSMGLFAHMLFWTSELPQTEHTKVSMGLLAHILLWTPELPQTEHTVGFMGIKINI